MSTKGDLDYAHSAGSQDASEDTGRCRTLYSDDENRAYKDGYYHTKGQIDHNEGRYDGWSIQGWLRHTDDDQANVDAYNSGHDAARESDSGK